MKYIEAVDNDYYCRAEKIDIFIPTYYFTSRMAKELGNTIDTVGMFYMEIYENNIAKPLLYQLNCPVVLHLLIAESSKTKRNFSKTSDEMKEYRVFTVHKNELMIKDAVNIQNPKSADLFVNFILGGKITDSIDYEDLPDAMIGNAKYNGLKLGIPYSLVEVMMAELARDAKDNFVPFRKVAGKTGAQTGYENLRINDIPNLSSTFSGISFENVNEAILSGVIQSKTGRKQTKSATEEILYF